MSITSASDKAISVWHMSAIPAPTPGPWTRGIDKARIMPSPVQTNHVLGLDDQGGAQ